MNSFRALCTVVDILVAAKNGLVTSADAAKQLEESTSLFFRLHKVAYATSVLKPKHHWLLDVPGQLRRDGMVLDAFVIERQHLLVKGVAEHIRNLSDFEGSLCSSVLTLQLQEGDDDALFDGLIGPTSSLDGFPRVRVANKLTCGCMVVRVGDFICRAADTGAAVACALEGAVLLVIVAVAVKVRDVTPTAVAVRRTDRLAVWLAGEVRQCVGWRPDVDGTTIVLRS